MVVVLKVLGAFMKFLGVWAYLFIPREIQKMRRWNALKAESWQPLSSSSNHITDSRCGFGTVHSLLARILLCAGRSKWFDRASVKPVWPILSFFSKKCFEKCKDSLFQGGLVYDHVKCGSMENCINLQLHLKKKSQQTGETEAKATTTFPQG